jgi:hypothetical protein
MSLSPEVSTSNRTTEEIIKDLIAEDKIEVMHLARTTLVRIPKKDLKTLIEEDLGLASSQRSWAEIESAFRENMYLPDWLRLKWQVKEAYLQAKGEELPERSKLPESVLEHIS